MFYVLALKSGVWQFMHFVAGVGM